MTTSTTSPTATSSSPASTTSSAAAALVTFTVVLTGLVMLVAGIWALLSPETFAEFVDFPNHVHFLHDSGAFQIGIGVVLLLALVWTDSLAVALAGAAVTNALHAVNHAVDLDLGGRASDPWLLGLLAALTVLALVLRRRQLGGWSKDRPHGALRDPSA